MQEDQRGAGLAIDHAMNRHVGQEYWSEQLGNGAAGETALGWREVAHATDETAQTVPSRAIRPDILGPHDNPNVIRG